MGMNKPTLLDKVRARLAEKQGAQLQHIANATGISYDTVLRIRDGKTDPLFGKVQALALFLGVVR